MTPEYPYSMPHKNTINGIWKKGVSKDIFNQWKNRGVFQNGKIQSGYMMVMMKLYSPI